MSTPERYGTPHDLGSDVQIREYLAPLLDSIEARRCVPFLGAGVSMDATFDPRAGVGDEKLHHAKVMARRLAVRLLAELHRAGEEGSLRDPSWRDFVWNELGWPKAKETATDEKCRNVARRSVDRAAHWAGSGADRSPRIGCSSPWRKSRSSSGRPTVGYIGAPGIASAPSISAVWYRHEIGPSVPIDAGVFSC